MTSPHESERSAKPLPTDLAEVGMSTMLGLSLPLLTVLLQCVAETESDWSFLNVTAPSGAWIGAARRAGEDQLTISTNHGDATIEAYADDRHALLVAHGFGHVPKTRAIRRSRHSRPTMRFSRRLASWSAQCSTPTERT